MNADIDTVRDAFDSYDLHKEKLDALLKNCVYLDFKRSESGNEKEVLTFYDINKKEILSSRYEHIGVYYMYNNNTRFWTWAWSVPFNEKNTTQTIKKFLNYGIDLPNTYGFLKMEITKSHFSIHTPVQLDMHCAVASYITKTPYVFEYINHPVMELERQYGSEKRLTKIIKHVNDLDLRIEELNNFISSLSSLSSNKTETNNTDDIQTNVPKSDIYTKDKLPSGSNFDLSDIIKPLIMNKKASQIQKYYMFLLDIDKYLINE